MSEEELVELRQNVAFARITGHMAAQMLLRIMPVLTKQGHLAPGGIEVMHALLLRHENDPMFSAEDRAIFGGWRAQLGKEDQV